KHATLSSGINSEAIINRDNHGYLEGSSVFLRGFASLPNINGSHIISGVTENSFCLSGIYINSISDNNGRLGDNTLLNPLSNPNNINIYNNVFRSICIDDSHTA